VDARAKALGVSRNRFVVDALKDKLVPRSEWPEELVETLSTPLDPLTASLAADLEALVLTTRRSRKRPPRL
jgi:hypothetical protein